MKRVLCFLLLLMLYCTACSHQEILDGNDEEHSIVTPAIPSGNNSPSQPAVTEPISSPEDKLITTFESACTLVEQLPAVPTQSAPELAASGENAALTICDYFARHKGYDGTDFKAVSFSNGYYINIHSVTTEYADDFRIIEFGNEYTAKGLSQYVLVQTFYDVWDNNGWVPHVACQPIAQYANTGTSTEKLLSAYFYGSWFSTNLILVSAQQKRGEFASPVAAVNIFNVESSRQELQLWEPVEHALPDYDLTDWQFTSFSSGNGYAISCGRHSEESALYPLSCENTMAGRAFKITCPYNKEHNLSLLPSTGKSYLVSIDGVDTPLDLSPTEYGKYYSIDEEGDEYIIEDPDGPIFDMAGEMKGCGWWCSAERDVMVTSFNNEPIGNAVFDFRRDTFWESHGDGLGERISFKTVYASSFPYDPEPGPAYNIFSIGIVNGNATDQEEWQAYSRAKAINVFLDGTLLYRLNLADTIDYQIFSLPLPIGFKYNTSFAIDFEIADIYAGEKGRTALSDITLEPSIPH